MNIKPSEKTIKDLLGTDRQFSIPRFQREYSWEKKNYSEFFDDIISSFSFQDGKLCNVQYFVGTMLFIGDYTDGTSTPIQVVDGQQRITTITILFSALSDKFKELGQTPLSEQIFKYIMTKNLEGEDVRILQSKTHYPFFAYYIQDIHKEHPQEATTEEEISLENTYRFFSDSLDERKLRALFKKKFQSCQEQINQLSYLDMLKAIRDQVLMIKFISISTTEKEQANRIFEILNGKGKKLASIDLIKNKIFEVLDTQEPADFAEEKWKELKRNLCYDGEDIGIGTFFKHFWTAKYSSTSMNKLAEDFEKKVTPKSKDKYKTFLLELCEFSKRYMNIIKPRKESYQNKQEYLPLVQSLKILSDDFNITQIRIPLLALLKKKDEDKITLTKLLETTCFLENFHFIHNGLLKKPTNKLEAIYANFARKLLKANTKANCVAIISDELVTKLRDITFSYEEFENRFISLTYSSKYSTDNVITKYIIKKIHLHYNNEPVFPENFTVEHIVPESSGVHAKNIGNLVLLEQNLNADVSTNNYAKKKSVYAKSRSIWMQTFVTDYDKFTENEIPERSKKLAEYYYTNILKYNKN